MKRYHSKHRIARNRDAPIFKGMAVSEVNTIISSSSIAHLEPTNEKSWQWVKKKSIQHQEKISPMIKVGLKLAQNIPSLRLRRICFGTLSCSNSLVGRFCKRRRIQRKSLANHDQLWTCLHPKKTNRTIKDEEREKRSLSTFKSFELVNIDSFKHVSKKSTWSLNNWSTVVTFCSLPSNACQFGSNTSKVTNARICCTNDSIRARKRQTRRRHPTNSGWLDREHRHGLVFCSIHMLQRACSTCLRCRRKRKRSWYLRMVFREITSESGNLTW